MERLHGLYDLVYQFGALFGALERHGIAPLALHIHFTTRLAEKYYPAWLPGSKAETEEWNQIIGEDARRHVAEKLAWPRMVAAVWEQVQTRLFANKIDMET